MNRWSRTRHIAPVPAPEPDAAQKQRPGKLVIGDEEMRALLASGQARPLSRVVVSFVRHDGRWWLDATGEWLAITDPEYAARLDQWASA